MGSWRYSQNLSPISPSDPMLALASVLMNFCTFQLSYSQLLKSQKLIVLHLLYQLNSEKRNVTNGQPTTFLKFAWMRKLIQKIFFVFQ
jgi:hypothetical protein